MQEEFSFFACSFLPAPTQLSQDQLESEERARAPRSHSTALVSSRREPPSLRLQEELGDPLSGSTKLCSIPSLMDSMKLCCVRNDALNVQKSDIMGYIFFLSVCVLDSPVL